MTDKPGQFAKLIAHIDDTVGTDLPPWPGGWPHDIEAALLDAVFSIRARYGQRRSNGAPATGVVAVVERWLDHRGGRADDLRVLASTEPHDLADVVGSQSRSSRRLKAEIVVDAANRLTSLAQVHTVADFTGSDQQRHAYVGTKGCGPVTWAYFGMLLGRPDAKPDRWLLRFASEAIGEPQSPEEVRVLVNAAAAHYGVDTSRLDHAIWRHASGRS